MSESMKTVSDAFTALEDALKAHAFSPTNGGAAEFGRVGKFVEALGPLHVNWDAGLAPNGKVAGKRGRKPKTEAGGETEAASEGSDAVTETQVETPVDTSGASSGRGRRAAA